MTIQYENISADFIVTRFPNLGNKVKDLQNSWMGMDLSPYTLFYDCIFKDIVVSLEHNNTEHIQKYFDFVEELLCSQTELVVDIRIGNAIENLIQTGFLEYFWDDLALYQLAQQYMGNKTKLLFDNIGLYLKVPTIKKKNKTQGM